MNKFQKSIITVLQSIVSTIVLFVAILLALAILWGAFDVGIILYEQLLADPFLRLGTEHLLIVFGSSLTVLVGIEIFINVILYLTKNSFNLKLVVATALTAVVRKVIILEYKVDNYLLIYSMAALIFALGISYWISSQVNDEETLT